jgi:hypothetical protein
MSPLVLVIVQYVLRMILYLTFDTNKDRIELFITGGTGYRMGGNGMPEWWKWGAEVVETVCRSGGNGVPNGWKRYAEWVEKGCRMGGNKVSASLKRKLVVKKAYFPGEFKQLIH